MSKEEFVEYVANDCITHMSIEAKQYFKDNPDASMHHFGYGMYIRNQYLYGKDLPYLGCQEDDLSHSIIEKIISIINAD